MCVIVLRIPRLLQCIHIAIEDLYTAEEACQVTSTVLRAKLTVLVRVRHFELDMRNEKMVT
jgi:hypothetical protein